MRQLIKFCLVGFSSTVIDKGIFWVLLSVFPLMPWWLCQSISFCFGVTNGFFWNRRWTFRAQNSGSSRQQYPKFFLTNVIGLLLNLVFTKLFLIAFTGQMVHAANPDKKTILIASLCAIPIVVVWNFSASRFWTFRPQEKLQFLNPTWTYHPSLIRNLAWAKVRNGTAAKAASESGHEY